MLVRGSIGILLMGALVHERRTALQVHRPTLSCCDTQQSVHYMKRNVEIFWVDRFSFCFVAIWFRVKRMKSQDRREAGFLECGDIIAPI